VPVAKKSAAAPPLIQFQGNQSAEIAKAHPIRA